ncbi:MAG: SIS domain-containing protein, partial [Pseudomonadota bacterium]
LVAMAPATARPDWLAEMGRRSFATPQARAVENTLGTVNRSLYQQDPAQMVRLADAMLGARMVYLTASRASYALAYFLHYVGRMALPSLHLIPRHMNSPIDELSVARPGDMMLAITFTPYSRDTVEACRFAQSRGVRLVLLTDSDVAVPDLAPEETLVASTLSTHYFGSYTGAMAVLELLVATLIDRAGPEAIARIDAYGKLRRDHDFYWDRPQKT